MVGGASSMSSLGHSALDCGRDWLPTLSVATSWNESESAWPLWPTEPGTLKLAALAESVPATGLVPPSGSCTSRKAEATPLPVSVAEAGTANAPRRAIHGPASQVLAICGAV